MNLLGRLFIVLIFIGSIMLMSWSVVLYATHTNWRKQAEKFEQDLKEKTQDLAELQKQKEAMESALTLEIASQKDRNVTLKERAELLIAENEAVQTNLAKKEAERATLTDAVASLSEETGHIRNRLEDANKKLLASQYEWAEMATDLVKRVDEAQSLAIQVAAHQAMGEQLAKDYRDMAEVMRRNGLTADPALYTSQPPTGIRGTVTEVRGGTVEISVGLDSGLVKGHQLDVVRYREGRSSYIGKIEITNVVADRAVARVMPEFRKGVVQRNDEVTYIEVNELVAH